MLGRDGVEGALPARAAHAFDGREHVGNPHLGKHPPVVTGGLAQHAKEGAFSGAQEFLLAIGGFMPSSALQFP